MNNKITNDLENGEFRGLGDLDFDEACVAYSKVCKRHLEKIFPDEDLLSFRDFNSHLLNTDAIQEVSAAREIRVTPMIEGWLKQLESEMHFRESTPKNKLWYEYTYNMKGHLNRKNYPDEGTNKTCFDSNKIDNPNECENCLSNYSGKLIVNYSSGCVDKLIKLFRNSADKAIKTKSFNAARYLLCGYAGEGKTAWLNYLFSAKQDEMWRQKVINLKLPFTDPILHDEFHKTIDGLSEAKKTDATRKYIDGLIGTKLIRIYKKHYHNSITTIITDYDCMFMESDDGVLSAEEVLNSVGGEQIEYNHNLRSWILTLKNGPMTKSLYEDLLNKHQESEKTINTINNLYEKSLRTLTLDQTKCIDDAIRELQIKGVISEEEYCGGWGNTIDKKDYYIANKEIYTKLVEILCRNDEYNYRLLVAFDGVDPHHNYDESESNVAEILKSIIDYLFIPRSNVFYASFLVVTRVESIDNLLLKNVFHGSLRGNMRLLELEPVSINKVLSARLENASANFNDYYKRFYTLVLNMASYLIYESLSGKRIDAIDLEKPIKSGLEVLYSIYRGNRRKVLSFIYLYVKQLFSRLSKSLDLMHINDSGNMGTDNALIDVTTYLDQLRRCPYILWNTLLCRDLVNYIPQYTYRIEWEEPGNKDSKSHVSREWNIEAMPKGDERLNYGIIPNIYDSIDDYDDMEVKNKIFLRIRLMQALSKQYRRYGFLCKHMAGLYDIHVADVEWEINELISTGFIRIRKGGNFAFNKNTAEKHPDVFLLEKTECWDHYNDNFIYNINYLVGVLPATNIHNKPFLLDTQYMPFTVVPSFLYHDIEFIKNRRTTTINNDIPKCYAAEACMLLTMMNYLSEIEIKEYACHKSKRLLFLNELNLEENDYMRFTKISDEINSDDMDRCLIGLRKIIRFGREREKTNYKKELRKAIKARIKSMS